MFTFSSGAVNSMRGAAFLTGLKDVRLSLLAISED